MGTRKIKRPTCWSEIVDLRSSRQTFGFDIDPNALHIARKNNKNFETDVNFILCDISTLCQTEESPDCPPDDKEKESEGKRSVQRRWVKAVDTVIMNPPFGTKIKGIDMVFLETAIKVG